MRRGKANELSRRFDVPELEQPKGPFVGSRKSQVYHFPSCRDVKSIKPENLVEYRTAPAGKRLHAGCPR